MTNPIILIEQPRSTPVLWYACTTCIGQNSSAFCPDCAWLQTSAVMMIWPTVHNDSSYTLILNLTLQPSSIGGSESGLMIEILPKRVKLLIADDIPRVQLSMRGSERGLQRSTVSSEIYKRCSLRTTFNQLKMVPLRNTFLVLASAIVIATAKNPLSNIKNVVVLVQENRYATIHISYIYS